MALANRTLEPVERRVGVAKAQPSNQPSVVGMWLAEFRTTGGQLWDQGFELFHADGTEVAVDNAVPPLLGNVCVGVWKSVAPRTIKLRHMTWNWNPDSTLAGTFLLLVTLTVGPDGNAYNGTFVSDSFDLQGTVIPGVPRGGDRQRDTDHGRLMTPRV